MNFYKSIHKNIEKYIDKKRLTVFLIGAAFFLFYLSMGMLLSFINEVDDSMYFGSDNSRAYTDLMQIKDTAFHHYRITVHPLMLILLQPVTGLASGITRDPRLALIILQAIVGMIAVLSVYIMLEKLTCSKWRAILLTCIYGCSFSVLVFSAVPETFIFSGASITLFVCFLLHINSDPRIEKHQYALLFLAGIFHFGITITNYIPYLIGLIYLLLVKFKKDKKQMLLEFFGINITNLDIILILTILQQKVWVESPTFIEGICDALFTKSQFEEYDYMNLTVTGGKLRPLLEQFTCYPLLASDVEKIQMNETYAPVLFQGFSVAIWIILAIFWFIFFAAAVRSLAIKKSAHSFALLLGILICFHFCLHYFYGYDEAFMYSPHYFFLFLLLLGIFTSNEKNKWISGMVYAGLLVVLIAEIIQNITVFKKVTMLMQLYYENYYYHETIILKALFLGIVLIITFVSLSKIPLRPKTVKTDGSVKEKVILCLTAYICLILIGCICIRFSFWRL